MPELRQRDPRVEDKAFLAFLRTQRCCVCGAPPPVQAAHIRMGNLSRGKRPTGIGEKPSDRHSVSLCATCHLDGPEALHKVGEELFWRRMGMNPFVFADMLYAEFAVGRHFTFSVNKSKPKRKRKKKPLTGLAYSMNNVRKNRPKRKWPKRRMR